MADALNISARLRSDALRIPFRLGVLELQGRDALDLLHRLTTNGLADMKPGEVRQTLLTTPKGRILDHLLVVNSQDALLVFCSASACDDVRKWIETYIFMDDVTCRDRGGECAVVPVFQPGPASPGWSLTTLENGWQGAAHESVTGHGWILFGPEGSSLPDWVTAMPMVDEHQWRLLRVEHLLPASEHELTLDFHPLEVGAKAAVSFSKGCYPGQEVISRLDSYDKVQRRLTALTIEGASPPREGSVLRVGETEAGILTTCTVAQDGSIRGLALLRNAYALTGTVLEATDGVQVLRLHITAGNDGVPPAEGVTS